MDLSHWLQTMVNTFAFWSLHWTSCFKNRSHCSPQMALSLLVASVQSGFVFVGCICAIWVRQFSWRGLLSTQCQLLHFVSMHPSHALGNGLGCFGAVFSLCTHCCSSHACLPLVVCFCNCWCFCCSAKVPIVAHVAFVVVGYSVGHSVGHWSQFMQTNCCISSN